MCPGDHLGVISVVRHHSQAEVLALKMIKCKYSDIRLVSVRYLPFSEEPVDFLLSIMFSSKSSRLDIFLASSFSRRCFFFLISENKEVSWIALSRLPRDLSALLGDLDLDLVLDL